MRRLFLGELKTTSFHREENMENLAAMNMKKTSTSAPAPAMAPATGILKHSQIFKKVIEKFHISSFF